MARHVVTQLAENRALARLLGVRGVHLKLENQQASGSFKDRGMLKLSETLRLRGVHKIVSSSGGNAGKSAAYCARTLGMRAHVVVPETTSEFMRHIIEGEGADVEVHGANWNAADLRARQIVAENPAKCGYAPPFDHPLLWEGHSSLVDELVEQWPHQEPPDAIAVSVGGGGLLAGVLGGLAQHGWDASTRVLAAETLGAGSLHRAMAQQALARLDRISSIASSLGALQVCEQALIQALSHRAGVDTVLVSDEMAVQGCKEFADLARILVEPACGTALAAARQHLAKDPCAEAKRIILVVCGGSDISLARLSEYADQAAERQTHGVLTSV
ncbi:L-serine dehydratase (SDH) (L-serine deaminase) [Durusdinium trenchii]|uniref:L-serine ammonia-lyase n=1 Tax=Durusdinium trenchii TaxID=1381693 RepID=A0ABP0J8K1_9DINO